MKQVKNEKKSLSFKNSIDRMKTRSFRVGGYSVISAAALIVIAILVNVLTGMLPSGVTQLDMTSNKLFSISDQTREICASLDRDVTVYWVAQMGTEDSAIETLLDRYENMSKHIKVKTVDPDVYPAFVKQFVGEEIEVENNSLLVVSGDKVRYIPQSEIYVVDLAALYNNGEYSADFEGEGNLTSALTYMMADDLPKVYQLVGHGEEDLIGDYLNSMELNNYDVAELSLVTVEAVPADADCVLLCAPTSDITTAEKDMLLTYLQGGGNMFIIADLAETGAERPNLDALAAEYGITSREGIILEADQTRYTYGTPYCLLPDIMLNDITAPLHGGSFNVVVPVAHPLEINEDLRKSLDPDVLLRTSKDAYSKVDGYAMTTYEKEENDLEGPFNVGVIASDYLDRDNGVITDVIYISSTAFVNETYNEMVGGANQDMFLNCLAYLCGFEDGITIHAKSLDTEYLNVNSATASTLSIILIAVVPLCILATGLVIIIRRRRK